MSVVACDIELDRQPRGLTSGGAQVATKWRVLWTKARQEKAVARFLSALGAKHYLPLVERRTVIRGRKFVSNLPLFPGYIFLDGTLEDGYAAIASKRVCQMIEVPDQERFIWEIGQIRHALEITKSLDLYPFAAVGRRCRVVKGPFMGFEGVITNRLGPERLVLEIGVLGQGAALEIDIDLLEPLT